MSDKKAEDVMGDAWDRCAEDLILKFGIGVLGGGVGAFFSKTKYSLRHGRFGAGFGAGSGYTECQYILANSKKSLMQKFTNAKRDLS